MINKIKGKKTNENMRIITASPSEIPTGQTIPNNRNNGLVVNPFHKENDEENDEEWLKAKHRILDCRIEHFRLLANRNKEKAQKPSTSNSTINENVLFEPFIDTLRPILTLGQSNNEFVNKKS